VKGAKEKLDPEEAAEKRRQKRRKDLLKHLTSGQIDSMLKRAKE
jgi:hypothetical protein